jgi:glycosyltransferase involved in cell wall biosynthesis
MDLHRFERISVMSASQIEYFIERGIPRERIHVTRHGVDTDFFSPEPSTPPSVEAPLAGLLVGSTERDHEFMAAVLKKLPEGILKLAVRTAGDQQHYYDGAPYVSMLPPLGEAELLAAYRSADLLLMPVLDGTANNAVLEAMACGTPVLTNRVGGVPEYVDANVNFVTDNKDIDEWVDLLVHLARNRSHLAERRPKVRAWAESFDWRNVVDDFRNFYEAATSHGMQGDTTS